MQTGTGFKKGQPSSIGLSRARVNLEIGLVLMALACKHLHTLFLAFTPIWPLAAPSRSLCTTYFRPTTTGDSHATYKGYSNQINSKEFPNLRIAKISSSCK